MATTCIYLINLTIGLRVMHSLTVTKRDKLSQYLDAWLIFMTIICSQFHEDISKFEMVSVMPISVARSKVHNHNVKGPKNVKWGTFCNMKGGTAYSQRGHGPLWPQASYVAGGRQPCLPSGRPWFDIIQANIVVNLEQPHNRLKTSKYFVYDVQTLEKKV